MAGEASSSRQKRQQLVEEDGDNGGGDLVARSGTLSELDLLDCPVCCHALTSPIFRCDNGHIACSSCCTNLRNKCPACTLPIGEFRCLIMEKVVEAVIVPCPNAKHGCTNEDGDVVAQSRTLFDLHLLDCPICSNALTSPIFQCDNGHIACSSCCTKLRYRCPACNFPIGNYRCRIMEKVVKAIIVPCPNAKHGCTEMFSYGKELVHVKKCSFALCYCPEPNCNYSGMYKDLYSHYDADHKKSKDHFFCNYRTEAWLHISEKILVLKEYRGGPIVVIQCFEKPEGLYVTVNCIAPSAPGVGEFSYHLSYMMMGGNTMTFKSPEMNRIQKVSFQTPEKDFMLIPYYFQGQRDSLKMEICISRLKKDEEEAEEEEEDED